MTETQRKIREAHFKSPATVFKRRLKARRRELGMTQAGLAAKAGISPTAICHYEAGAREPSSDTLIRLCEALKISMDYLFGKKRMPPSSVVSDPIAAEILQGLMTFNERDKRILCTYAEFLWTKRREK